MKKSLFFLFGMSFIFFLLSTCGTEVNDKEFSDALESGDISTNKDSVPNNSGQLANSEENTESSIDEEQSPSTTKPYDVSLIINDGTETTNSLSVLLNLMASDDLGIIGYYVSETNSIPLADIDGWIEIESTASYSSQVSFTLSDTLGEKTVYVWFLDSEGNVSDGASDKITYVDETAPLDTSISINGGDNSSSSITITLSLSSSDSSGIVAYYVSEDSTTPPIDTSGWVEVSSTTSYSAEILFNLSGGNSGERTVYAWFKDALENISDAVSDSIVWQSAVLTTVDSNGMIQLSGGTFTMGDIQGGGQPAESPAHSVTLSNSFYISDHEVTAAEFKSCVDAGGCRAVTSGGPYNIPGKENHPITYVSWNDAQDYAIWMTQNSNRNYRLCSEAEWEYAARAGSTTKWSCGNDELCLDEMEWYSSNVPSPGEHMEVKTKRPNAWGLYDMHGNLTEWVQDFYSSDYYSTVASGVTDPTGPSSGTYYVTRGSSTVEFMRSAFRLFSRPPQLNHDLGFRVCSSN